jgi:hypothetical protein
MGTARRYRKPAHCGIRCQGPHPATKSFRGRLPAPSGEHGLAVAATFPLLTTWKVLTALPIFSSVWEFTVYLIRILETTDCFSWPDDARAVEGMGVIAAIWSPLPAASRDWHAAQVERLVVHVLETEIHVFRSHGQTLPEA